jgi:integrase
MQRSQYNFINSINSKETRQKYESYIKDFMNFLKIKDYDSLLKINIEKSIIDYIVSLRKKVSSATLHTRLASVYHFYTMNDVLLNKTKISKYKGEFLRVKKDRAYTNQEISKLLQIADLRMKVCILLMASSGLRLGAIPDLKLKHLHDNKLTVYESSRQEYFVFLTPETSAVIEEYINYRKRSGEKITKESYLIRDIFDDLTIKKPRQITRHAIRIIIFRLLKKTGLNTGEVSMTHGFRKFFTTQVIHSKVSPEVREMLVGHKIGLAGVYYKPTPEQMYEEYVKAIPLLTISDEERLKFKLEEHVQIQKTQYESLKSEFEKFKTEMKKRKK